MKKFFILLLFIIISAPVFAFEDCIISNDGKLTNIKIENNTIIDVFPLITIENNKNTLIVHPLKVGESKFSVIKNDKDKIIFNVKVTNEKTFINETAGFDILTIDCPPNQYEFDFDLDEPPALGKGEN